MPLVPPVMRATLGVGVDIVGEGRDIWMSMEWLDVSLLRCECSRVRSRW
jgi:hypothetical protein